MHEGMLWQRTLLTIAMVCIMVCTIVTVVISIMVSIKVIAALWLWEREERGRMWGGPQ